MRGNLGKCHPIMSTSELHDFQLGSSLFVTIDCEKILGVKIDYKLNFDKHVNTLCRNE